jgi:DNA transformation protein and related proteins
MSGFVEHLHDVFESFGPITTRKMFGGYGIYHDGLMFGLVADDTLYLKVDEKVAPEFEREGLEHFVYNKNGRDMKMSYRRAPDVIFDNREQAAVWAERSFKAARRARKSK